MTMKQLSKICRQNGISLCYLFGSQKDMGLARLNGIELNVEDPESDIDFAVLFSSPPKNSLQTYAKLSVDLGDLVSPFRADLLFLHEVDHLIQLEAIQGINVYAIDNIVKDTYESKVMAFAADSIHILKQNEIDFFEAVRDGYFEFKYQAHSG